jgi:hypothetical protein
MDEAGSQGGREGGAPSQAAIRHWGYMYWTAEAVAVHVAVVVVSVGGARSSWDGVLLLLLLLDGIRRLTWEAANEESHAQEHSRCRGCVNLTETYPRGHATAAAAAATTAAAARITLPPLVRRAPVLFLFLLRFHAQLIEFLFIEQLAC